MQIGAVGGTIELSDKISLVALMVAILSFAISIISIYVQKNLILLIWMQSIMNLFLINLY
ncbi:MAG: hypothetical protein EGS63_01490 [Lachnospira sp.]|nr:hypothetical protein [Lachnospira sp.]